MVVGFFSSLLGGSGAKADNLGSEADLRARVMEVLRTRPEFSEIKADEETPSSIHLKIGDTDIIADVGNLYDYLKAYPEEDQTHWINQFAEQALGSVQDNVKAEALMPLVRAMDYIRAMQDNGLENIQYEPLAGDLVLAFGFDSPRGVSLATKEDIASIEVEDFRSIAFANLEQLMNAKLYDDQWAEMVSFGLEDNTILSPGLLVLDAFWEKVNSRFPEGALVINPRRDQIMLIDKRNPDAVNIAHRMINATFKDDYALQSRGIYERVDGKLRLVNQN